MPSLDAVAPPEASFRVTAIFSGLAALVFLYGFKHWRDSGRPIIFVMMLGGLATVFVEPFLDVIGGPRQRAEAGVAKSCEVVFEWES